MYFLPFTFSPKVINHGERFVMRSVKLWIGIIIPLLVLMIPREYIPIDGLTVIQHRIIAIFLMATFFWILEPVPIYATSILIITLELLMTSDHSLVFFRESPASVDFGILLNYKAIIATLASPIIILFLGGFFLALAATKYRLDINLARVLLKPFGSDPRAVLLGLMVVTAVFSMFMSNTATTAMMLAILTPVLLVFPDHDPGRTAFVLGIPFAANVGGIGTPIGTPPNAVAMKYLSGDLAVSFGEWMAFALPYVIVLLLFLWILLLFLFKPVTRHITLDIKNKFMKTRKAWIVYITFGLTILLWLLTDVHGMNAYIVAMIPVCVFLVTQIITREDLKRISWDVLWLISGGIALGLGLEESGLTRNLVNSIPFGSFPPLVIILMATVLTLLMANFMSHTATANLLLPIAAAIGTNISSLSGYGGSKGMILGVTFAASIAMSLPISTPPNAMAYASGKVKTPEMARTGVIMGITGMLLVYLMLFVLHRTGVI